MTDPTIKSQHRQVMVTILLLTLLSPFLLNALFANPLTDDFTYAVTARDHGFWVAQAKWYQEWTGRYLSTALLSLSPLVFDWLWGYKLVPLLLLAGLAGGGWFLLTGLAGATLTGRDKIVFVLLFLLLYLDQLPDLRPGLYWMAGSVTYQSGAILISVYMAFLYRIVTREGHASGGRASHLAAVVLALLLPGTNEICLVLALLLSIPALALAARKRTLGAGLILVLLTLFFGASVAVLAPGNAARLTGYGGGTPLFDVLRLAGSATFEVLSVWCSEPWTLALALLIAISVFRRPALRNRFQGVHPALVTLLFVLLVMACYIPPLWSTGHRPHPRVVNLIYLVFLWGWVFNAAYWSAALARRAGQLRTGRLFTIAWLLFGIYAVVVLPLGRSNTLLVLSDLYDGHSLRYDRELQARYAVLRAETGREVSFAPLVNRPRSLYFNDLQANPDHWINRAYADYFRQRSVVVENASTEPPVKPF